MKRFHRALLALLATLFTYAYDATADSTVQTPALSMIETLPAASIDLLEHSQDVREPAGQPMSGPFGEAAEDLASGATPQLIGVSLLRADDCDSCVQLRAGITRNARRPAAGVEVTVGW